MTLKIEKVSAGPKTIIRLSGRLQAEHLDEFKTQIKGDHSPIALDLDGVTLVDVEVVRFLNACKENNVELLHCSPFIREWMLREQDRKE
jgi:anti-anti-sigma regulatory factor